ncbi:MAG: acyltransferase domain-containing protein [bacterium]
MMTILTAQAVLEGIRETTAYGGAPMFWDQAMAEMPAGPLPFLEPADVPARRAAAGLPAERDVLLTGIAAVIDADPALRSLAWYLHWRVFVAPQHGAPWGAPSLLPRLGEQAGLFYLLLSLEFVPRLTIWHRHLGYPGTVTRQTLQQIASFEGNHLRGRGRPGIYESQFVWLATYLVDPYVRLGRFEYQLHTYGGGVSVWKRAADGQVLALAEEGTRVAADGLRLGDQAPATEGWTAWLKETPSALSGFPVDPVGRILDKPVHLDRSVWMPCFSKGATVLDLHIPAGGSMDWEAMTDSFRQALAFFQQHHADRPFAALVVNTWFMDPRLADILPAESNPLRFQRAVYLYPVPPQPDSLWFVFLGNTREPAALRRDTSLQRRLATFLENGGTWHGGGMFVLPGDMHHLCDGHYRNRFNALIDSGNLRPITVS